MKMWAPQEPTFSGRLSPLSPHCRPPIPARHQQVGFVLKKNGERWRWFRNVGTELLKSECELKYQGSDLYELEICIRNNKEFEPRIGSDYSGD